MRNLIIIVILVFIPSSLGAKELTYTLLSMIRDFLNVNRTTLPMEMNISYLGDVEIGRLTKRQHLMLKSSIVNDSPFAICVPSIFFSAENFIPIEPILNVRTSEGKMVPPLKYAYEVKWPVREFVVVPRNSSASLNINLSEYFDFGNALNGPAEFEVEFSIPAFACKSLERGYPVTAQIMDMHYLLLDVRPIAVLKNKDVRVFRGNVTINSA